MRRLLLAASTFLAAGLAGAPLLADTRSGESDVPARVSLAPDELLAPYYAALRKQVAMPEAGANPALAPTTTLTRIAFGSCNHQSASQAYWAQIAAQNPQLFLMIGDNVYGDNAWDGDAGLESLRQAYLMQAAHPEFRAFRAKVPMLATWDDHDFGLNDAGGSFPMRRWSEALFESFWGSPERVRSREGVYDSIVVGPEGRRVQIILLDTRFFRSDLKRAAWSRERPPLGSYLPDDNPAKTMLGAAQWAWLEAELARPADLRIVVSSIQVITEAHQFERWANFPAERARLLDLLARDKQSGLVLLSGDRHAGAIYRSEHRGKTFWELTSSSLNLASGTDIEHSSAREPDAARVTKLFPVENYGLIEIDWKARRLTMILKDKNSTTLAQQSFNW
jgi:alkaline phosphatase D